MEALVSCTELFARLPGIIASDLERVIWYYYPMQGDVDIPEGMTASYVGHALRFVGFHVYPWIQWRKHESRQKNDEHVDLVAIHPDYHVLLVAEGKQLNKSEKAERLGADWVRMNDRKLPCDNDSLPPDLPSFACLWATTWMRSIADWWQDSSREAAPRGFDRDARKWHNTRDALTQSALCSAVRFTPRQQSLWLLMTFIPRPNGLWN